MASRGVQFVTSMIQLGDRKESHLIPVHWQVEEGKGINVEDVEKRSEVEEGDKFSVNAKLEDCHQFGDKDREGGRGDTGDLDELNPDCYEFLEYQACERKTHIASISPMAHSACTHPVVLPSQVSSGQVKVARVQPTVCISPSVSSARGTSGPQLSSPCTSQPQQLDAAAPEFYLAGRVAGGPNQGEEPSSAGVTLRQDQPQASSSGPGAANLLHAPSTSDTSARVGACPTTPTTACVPPALKCPRDSTALESDSQSRVEDRVCLSGYQKKARSISSTELL